MGMDKEFLSRKTAAPDRWYLDPGAIPGESSYYLDVPPVLDDDLDKAVGIVSEIDGRGFEAVAIINENNHHLGRFESAEQAKEAVEQAQAKHEASINQKAGGTRPSLPSSPFQARTLPIIGAKAGGAIKPSPTAIFARARG
jgi:hypothetical protein